MVAGRTDVLQGTVELLVLRTLAWRVTENNRRARYYSLTAAGREQFDREQAAWERTVNAVSGVLNWAGGTE